MLGIQTLTLGMHFAALDQMTGSGLLLLPPEELDVRVGTESILLADWNAAIRRLDAVGWQLSEDEDGGLMDEGRTADGCMVVGLYGRDPVTSDPSLDECIDAFSELSRVVGLISRYRAA